MNKKEFKTKPLWEKVLIAIACFEIGLKITNNRISFFIGYDLKQYGHLGGFQIQNWTLGDIVKISK